MEKLSPTCLVEGAERTVNVKSRKKQLALLDDVVKSHQSSHWRYARDLMSPKRGAHLSIGCVPEEMNLT